MIIDFYMQEMTLITFIANLGGMMGLCMGLSFVSIVEIIFFSMMFILRREKKDFS